MSVTALVGLQWGDEGKGKVVDYLAADMDVVARGAGGANAGHTIVLDDGTKRVLHLLPSGMVRPDPLCLMGAGMVVEPWQMVSEMKEAGLEPSTASRRLLLSPRAQMVLPYHRILEERLEAILNIGTTRRGIGPTYALGALRMGTPVGLLGHREELRAWLQRMHDMVAGFGSGDLPDPLEVLESLDAVSNWLLSTTGNVTGELHRARAAGKRILLEGAQGVMLDLLHGTYPFVTSSSTTATGLAAGVGLGPSDMDRVIGVVKAYTTRVGEGPFPTEEHGPAGEMLAQKGGEFGATTGRPRRCGWLDLVALKWAVRVSGARELVLTKLDVLDGLEEIPLCVAYEVPGLGRVEDMPEDAWLYAKVRPVYEMAKGWSSSAGLSDPHVRDYISLIEEFTGARVIKASWGPRRSQMGEP